MTPYDVDPKDGQHMGQKAGAWAAPFDQARWRWSLRKSPTADAGHAWAP